LIDEDGEVRELTLADIRRMKPIREVMPELIEAVEQHRKKLGRPRSESPKVHIGFRLSADLVERIRASGRGYNARVEEALRKADFDKAKDEAQLGAEARKTAAKKKSRLAQKRRAFLRQEAKRALSKKSA
jgi:uncharacterized protein (DUF4415 family)